MKLVHLFLLFFVLRCSECVVKRKTTIAASSNRVTFSNVTATPKHDYRDSGEYLGLTSTGKDFPHKVIRVTKTIAVQVPVPVPVKFHHDSSVSSSIHPTSEPYQSSVTPPILPTKRTTTTRPKPGSSADPFENSIWQQNFPPFTSSGYHGKKKKYRTTTTEVPPTGGYINISQDPNTKAVNIRIPWNAAMKDGFLDDISRNPQPLLNSLNLLPAIDTSSYGSPATGHSMDATIFTSQKELQDFSQFYNIPHMDDPMGDFNVQPPSPQYSSYTEHSQSHGDEHSNFTSYYRYPSKRPHHSTTPKHNEVDYKAEEPKSPRPRRPQKHADLESYQSTSSHTFLGAFTPDDSTFANSDVNAKLREYEKRVEKEVIDSKGSFTHVSGTTKYEPSAPQKSTTKRPPSTTRAPRTKKPKKYHILIKKS